MYVYMYVCTHYRILHLPFMKVFRTGIWYYTDLLCVWTVEVVAFVLRVFVIFDYIYSVVSNTLQYFPGSFISIT